MDSLKIERFSGQNISDFVEYLRERWGTLGLDTDLKQLNFLKGRLTKRVLDTFTKWHGSRLDEDHEYAMTQWREGSHDIEDRPIKQKSLDIDEIIDWFLKEYKDQDNYVRASNLLELAKRFEQTGYSRIENYKSVFDDVLDRIRPQDTPEDRFIIEAFLKGCTSNDREWLIEATCKDDGGREEIWSVFEKSIIRKDQIQRAIRNITKDTLKVDDILSHKNKFSQEPRLVGLENEEPVTITNNNTPNVKADDSMDTLVKGMQDLKIFLASGGRIEQWKGNQKVIEMYKAVSSASHVSTTNQVPVNGPTPVTRTKNCTYCDRNKNSPDNPHEYVGDCTEFIKDQQAGWPVKFDFFEGRRMLVNLDGTLPYPTRFNRGGVKMLLQSVNELKISQSQLTTLMQEAATRIRGRFNNGPATSSYMWGHHGSARAIFDLETDDKKPYFIKRNMYESSNYTNVDINISDDDMPHLSPISENNNEFLEKEIKTCAQGYHDLKRKIKDEDIETRIVKSEPPTKVQAVITKAVTKHKLSSKFIGPSLIIKDKAANVKSAYEDIASLTESEDKANNDLDNDSTSNVSDDQIIDETMNNGTINQAQLNTTSQDAYTCEERLTIAFDEMSESPIKIKSISTSRNSDNNFTNDFRNSTVIAECLDQDIEGHTATYSRMGIAMLENNDNPQQTQNKSDSLNLEGFAVVFEQVQDIKNEYKKKLLATQKKIKQTSRMVETLQNLKNQKEIESWIEEALDMCIDEIKKRMDEINDEKTLKVSIKDLDAIDCILKPIVDPDQINRTINSEESEEEETDSLLMMTIEEEENMIDKLKKMRVAPLYDLCDTCIVTSINHFQKGTNGNSESTVVANNLAKAIKLIKKSNKSNTFARANMAKVDANDTIENGLKLDAIKYVTPDTLMKPVCFKDGGAFYIQVNDTYVTLSKAISKLVDTEISDEEAYAAWGNISEIYEEEDVDIKLGDVIAEVEHSRILAAYKRKEGGLEDGDQKRMRDLDGKKVNIPNPLAPNPLSAPEVNIPRPVLKPIVRRPPAENVTPDVPMKDIPTVSEKNKRPPPKFTYAMKGPITEIKVNEVIERFFKTPGGCTLSMDELCAISPIASKRMFESLKTHRIPIEEEVAKIAKDTKIPEGMVSNVVKSLFSGSHWPNGDDDSYFMTTKLLGSNGDISELPIGIIAHLRWNAEKIDAHDKKQMLKMDKYIESNAAVWGRRTDAVAESSFMTLDQYRCNRMVANSKGSNKPFHHTTQYSTYASPILPTVYWDQNWVVKNSLLDTGAEMNCVCFDLAKVSYESSIDRKTILTMLDVNGGSAKLFGIIRNASIGLSEGVIIEQKVFVQPELNKTAQVLLLGQPFIMAARIIHMSDNKGNMYTQFQDQNSEKKVRIKTVDWNDHRNRLEIGIPNEKKSFERFDSIAEDFRRGLDQ